ncbi:hypothetical protein GCM10010994_02380 [Chelatococcus reniformis]|uniref:Uncharacterized protein n=1 Tax=Chelatococcus reniformis TaxID=1494448 RepID=A0A916X840_9HYPH|nr:hypothetical protein GCM10010994_02380 [Chelatococcus reniformis]
MDLKDEAAGEIAFEGGQPCPELGRLLPRIDRLTLDVAHIIRPSHDLRSISIPSPDTSTMFPNGTSTEQLAITPALSHLNRTGRWRLEDRPWTAAQTILRPRIGS